MQNTFGIEWTPELHEPLIENLYRLSAIEIIPENFFEGRFLNFLTLTKEQQIPVSVHGVLLSIGSAEPLKERHLSDVLEIANQVNTVFYSEHLSLTEAGGLDFDALTPMAWTEGMLAIVGAKIEQIQSKIEYPFLIENVSNRFMIPHADFTETEFINKVLNKTGCGLLLDVTNVYTNARNFNFDPYEWLDQIDISATRVIHLAGGSKDPDGFVIDSHDNTIPSEVWDLYTHVCKQTSGFMTIIERTSNLPDIESLLHELDIAREIADHNCSQLIESTVSDHRMAPHE